MNKNQLKKTLHCLFILGAFTANNVFSMGPIIKRNNGIGNVQQAVDPGNAPEFISLSSQEKASVYIFRFQLPGLGGGKVADADFQFNLEVNDIQDPDLHIDFYGIRANSDRTILSSDYFIGDYGTDDNAIELEDDIISSTNALGIIESDSSGDNNLASWIQSLYDNDAQPGDYVFIRLSPDQNFVNTHHLYKITDTDGESPPSLRLTIVGADTGDVSRMMAPSQEDRIDLDVYTTWPKNHGDAQVTLWQDDKVAAVSLTIDDNIVPDHPFWMEMGDNYNMNFTWFVVTQHPTGEIQPPNKYWGTDWEPFILLGEKGHSIQSHSVHHICSDATDPEVELGKSRNDIESVFLESNALGVAGPCGMVPAFNILSHYYSVHRGVSGGVNSAKNINYSAVKVMTYTPEGKSINDLILNPEERSWPSSYRGWVVYIFHSLGEKKYDQTESFISDIASHADTIWEGLFIDVAKYGQERDSHQLKVNDITPDAIQFTLTDNLLDSEFDYPLTVKIRVNDKWLDVRAKQDGVAVKSRLVTYSNKKYVLVSAVPDKGLVTVRSLDISTNVSIQPGDANNDGNVSIQDTVLIINQVLEGKNYTQNSDCNSDGSLNIQDVICTINSVLNL